MTGFLLYEGAAERITRKAAHMTQTDPHGFILVLVCVCVVFGALLILYFAYSITGRIFTAKDERKQKSGFSVKPVAADCDADDDEAAAIAVAIYSFVREDGVHDIESGVITIKR